MGNTLPKEQQINLEVLQYILKTKNRSVSTLSLITFLDWVRKNVPDFPKTGTFDKDMWDQIGTKLWDAAAGTDNVAAKQLPVWWQISEALVELRKGTNQNSEESTTPLSAPPPPSPANTDVAEESLSGDPFVPGPTDPDQEPNLVFSNDKWKEAVGNDLTPSSDCHSVGDRCRKEALARGDTDILQAFPVIYRGNRPGAWEALSYDHVKELRKSVKDYGLQSGYTMNLLTAVGDGYVMTPHDWKLLLRMILSAMQYAGFMTEYRDLATAKALENFTGNLNHVGMNELVGEGPRATPDVQAWTDGVSSK